MSRTIPRWHFVIGCQAKSRNIIACRPRPNGNIAVGRDRLPGSIGAISKRILPSCENTFDASTVGFLNAPTTNPWMDGFPFTAPVGSFRSNAFGLYDMLGNVREFCSDNFMSNYGTRAKSFDPTGPVPEVWSEEWARGGSWMQYAVNSRSASRSQGKCSSTARFHDLGFRVVQQEGMLLQKEPPPSH